MTGELARNMPTAGFSPGRGMRGQRQPSNDPVRRAERTGMMKAKRIRNGAQLAASSAAMLMLAACGGGGGSSGDAGGGGGAAAINSSNGTAVASRVYSVANVLYSTGENAAQVVDVKSAGTPSRDVQFNLAEFALRKVLDFEADRKAGAKLAGKAVETYADTCSLGGSF